MSRTSPHWAIMACSSVNLTFLPNVLIAIINLIWQLLYKSGKLLKHICLGGKMNLSNDCKFPCSRTRVMWTLGLLRSSLPVIKRVADA
jgi:hypothetical protein